MCAYKERKNTAKSLKEKNTAKSLKVGICGCAQAVRSLCRFALKHEVSPCYPLQRLTGNSGCAAPVPSAVLQVYGWVINSYLYLKTQSSLLAGSRSSWDTFYSFGVHVEAIFATTSLGFDMSIAPLSGAMKSLIFLKNEVSNAARIVEKFKDLTWLDSTPPISRHKINHICFH